MTRIYESWWFRDLGWLVASFGTLLILIVSLPLYVDSWPGIATIVFTSFFIAWWLFGYLRDRKLQTAWRPRAAARSPVREVQKADMRHAGEAA